MSGKSGWWQQLLALGQRRSAPVSPVTAETTETAETPMPQTLDQSRRALAQVLRVVALQAGPVQAHPQFQDQLAQRWFTEWYGISFSLYRLLVQSDDKKDRAKAPTHRGHAQRWYEHYFCVSFLHEDPHEDEAKLTATRMTSKPQTSSYMLLQPIFLHRALKEHRRGLPSDESRNKTKRHWKQVAATFKAAAIVDHWKALARAQKQESVQLDAWRLSSTQEQLLAAKRKWKMHLRCIVKKEIHGQRQARASTVPWQGAVAVWLSTVLAVLHSSSPVIVHDPVVQELSVWTDNTGIVPVWVMVDALLFMLSCLPLQKILQRNICLVFQVGSFYLKALSSLEQASCFGPRRAAGYVTFIDLRVHHNFELWRELHSGLRREIQGWVEHRGSYFATNLVIALISSATFAYQYESSFDKNEIPLLLALSSFYATFAFLCMSGA